MSVLGYSHPSFPSPSLPLAFAYVGKNPIPRGRKSGSRQPKPKDQSGRRILIIEDDPSSLELFNCLLEASGYTMLLAKNGEEGLEMVRFQHPSLIVCDVRLPGLGGYELVRYLKADPALRWIPIVAVTALGSESERERFLAAGFDGFIPKPIEAESFVEEIENILEPVKN